MIDFVFGVPQKMASRQISSVKSPTTSRSFTRALSQALYEWLLIFMLFINAICSYLITKFADFSKLQTPCLLCSRLDHILGNKRLNHYWDLICSKHKSEISSLVYCHAHNMLVDVHGMCETCLFSFATINKSNAETYRLLVGKLGDISCFDDSLHEDHGCVPLCTRYCSCCNQPWVPRGDTQELTRSMSGGTKTVEPSDLSSFKVSDRATCKKKVGFNHLPHVGYTMLKIHSDTESEAVVSEDDDDDDVDHKFQTIELEPRVVSLSYDSAAEKLIDSVSGSDTLVLISEARSDVTKAAGVSTRHGLEELNWEEMHLKNGPSRVSELISIDNIAITSEAREYPADVSKERERFSLDDVPLASEAHEQEELISVDEIPVSSNSNKADREVSEENDIIPPVHKNVHPSSTSVEFMVEVPAGSRDSRTVETRERTITGTEAAPEKNRFPRVSTLQFTNTETETNSSLSEQNVTETAQETNHSSNDSPTLQLLETTKEPNLSLGELDATKTALEANPIPDDSSTLQVSEFETEPIPSFREQKVTETDPDTDPIPNDPSTLQVSETAAETSPSLGEQNLTETASETNLCPDNSSTLHLLETATETNPSTNDSNLHVTHVLDLTDAYKIAVANRAKRQSSPVYAEKWTGKDSPRTSEDLKALLAQLSTSTRGIELSPKDRSPKISITSDDLKNFDGTQLILQKRISLERNESNLSLDGVTVPEIEGESDIERLKRQVEHDRKLLNGLYKELEEERNASAVAANQAMAMITRLQEEKAMLQMEALQNLRMMEEQAEYDMQALHETNDLLTEKEKEIQDLEAELELYQMKFPDVSTTGNIVAKNEKLDHSEGMEEFKEHDVAGKVDEADFPCNGMSNMIKNSLLGFEDERFYISECLDKLEKKLHLFSNNGIYSDTGNCEYMHEGDEASSPKESTLKDGSQENGESDENHLRLQENVSSDRNADVGSLEDEVSELHERLETLKGDLYFLEHIVNSLKHGDEGVQFIKEIASHLLTLRTIGVRRRDQTID